MWTNITIPNATTENDRFFKRNPAKYICPVNMVKSALQQEAEIEPDLQDSSRYVLIAQKAPFDKKAQEKIYPG